MSIYNSILFYNNGNTKIEISIKQKRGEGKSGTITYYHAQTKIYYKSGKLKCLEERILYGDTYISIDTFDNGKRTGLFKYFFENGQIKIEGNFKSDIKVGVWKEYYENGQIKTSQMFFDHPDMKFGDSTRLFEIKKSIPIGCQKEWHPNGTLKRENKFRNIVLKRDYQGVEIWDSAVQKWVLKEENIIEVNDDIILDWLSRFASDNLFNNHPNHHIRHKKGWTKDGILLFEHHYRWNKKEKKINLHGTSKEYDGSAALNYKKQVLKYERNYRNGKLHGIQKAYDISWAEAGLTQPPSFKTKIKNGKYGHNYGIERKNIEETMAREYWLSDGYYLSGKVVNEYESSDSTINLKKDTKSKTVKIVKIEPIRYNSWGSVIREGFDHQRRRCMGDIFLNPECYIYEKEDSNTPSMYRNSNGLKTESWRFHSILEKITEKYYNLFENHIFETKLKLSRFWFFETDAWGKRTTK